MTACLSWVHFGDLHVDEADGLEGLHRFETLVGLAEQHLGDAVDFALLPGDNANHGTEAQYRGISNAMSRFGRSWHVLAGDHDFEPGNLDAMRAITTRDAPYAAHIRGYRCLFLDIVSAGKGGPDFRIDPAQRRWIERELDMAGAAGERSVVFMHAYPGDLRDDPDGVAGVFAAHRVVFVDTGHTHYNELLNDGRVIYGATRSIGQSEEGAPGFSVVTIDDGVPSWRFQAIDAVWPLVQITTPADRRLITDPACDRQVPQGGFTVRARIFGGTARATVCLDDGPEIAMVRVADVAEMWTATLPDVEDGLHQLRVTAGGSADVIEVLVRGPEATPKRTAPVALGRNVHAIGAWPEHDIDGAQRGPNRNGADW
jgi:Icc protein